MIDDEPMRNDRDGEVIALDTYVEYEGVSYLVVGFDADVAFCRRDGEDTLRQIHCGRLVRDYDHRSSAERIEDAVQAMVDTQPSWGWRLSRVWSALGHDFGTGDEIQWSMEREFFRHFSYSAEARAAMAAGDANYPPLSKIEI